MINNLDHKDWIKYGSKEYFEFNEYILRQKKFKKKNLTNEMFLTLCRITFILGEPMSNWIHNFI
jgi:hypothetical protein